MSEHTSFAIDEIGISAQVLRRAAEEATELDVDGFSLFHLAQIAVLDGLDYCVADICESLIEAGVSRIEIARTISKAVLFDLDYTHAWADRPLLKLVFETDEESNQIPLTIRRLRLLDIVRHLASTLPVEKRAPMAEKLAHALEALHDSHTAGAK